MKKILVIIPFYNVEKYLNNSIESILQQTHTNLELILVDDCSTDNSLEIAKSYEDLNNVTLLQNKENIGTYQSVNTALHFAQNKEWDYWTFQGSDDMSPTGVNKDELLTKLNQVIYLLEEQQNEKTGHVTEELILYSFLGIFIIFIVDSFARVGKYVR